MESRSWLDQRDLRPLRGHRELHGGRRDPEPSPELVPGERGQLLPSPAGASWRRRAPPPSPRMGRPTTAAERTRRGGSSSRSGAPRPRRHPASPAHAALPLMPSGTFGSGWDSIRPVLASQRFLGFNALGSPAAPPILSAWRSARRQDRVPTCATSPPATAARWSETACEEFNRTRPSASRSHQRYSSRGSELDRVLGVALRQRCRLVIEDAGGSRDMEERWHPERAHRHPPGRPGGGHGRLPRLGRRAAGCRARSSE